MLVYLHVGSDAFFTKQLAGRLFEHASPNRIGYWAVLYQFASAFVILLLVPIGLLKLTGEFRLKDLGFGLGDWKLGLWVIILGWIFISLAGGVGAGSMEDFRAEYPLARAAVESPARFVIYQLAYGLLYYTAWEGFFRGLLQLGLCGSLGPWGAMLFQTATSTLLHIGKPQLEIWAALVAGMLFGLIVLRCRSIWPLVCVHWGLGLTTDLSCAFASGSFS